MKRLTIAICTLLLLTGCATTKYDTVDVRKIEGLEDFDWNGQIEVTRLWHPDLVLGEYEVHSIRLTSTDGRSLLLDTSRGDVRAYTAVETQKGKAD